MRTGESGFAYVLLLVAVAIVAATGASALSRGSAMGQRSAERELLYVGQAFENALHSYAGVRHPGENTPQAPTPMTLAGPMALEDLLKDPRTPGLRRHLRKLYADPITGQAQWGLVRDAAGRIVGIHSLSERPPLKTHGFGAAHARFEQARHYSEWVFGLPAAQGAGVPALRAP